MLVLTRVRLPDDEVDAFRSGAEDLLDLLAVLPGVLRGHLGRAPDEPDLWVLATEWDTVGAYRRALSTYDVKVSAATTLARALPEAGAYEVLSRRGGSSGDEAAR